MARSACIAALTIAGCAPSRTPNVVNPAYPPAKLEGRVLHVFPWTGIELESPQALKESFGLKQAPVPAIVDSLLGPLFRRKLASLSDHVRIAADAAMPPDTSRMRDTIMMVPYPGGETEASFRIPSDTAVAASGFGGDVGLQIMRIHLAVVEPNRPPGSSGTPFDFGPHVVGTTPAGPLYAGGASGSGLPGRSGDLRFSAGYVLWDYKEHVPIAYGNVRVGIGFHLWLGRGDWERVFESAADAVVKNTPLKGKRYALAHTKEGAYGLK